VDHASINMRHQARLAGSPDTVDALFVLVAF
jgi:hypothetical protein